jgi:hypothetical protein
MKKGRLIRLDYSMVSSYLGRSATVIVFAGVILLALGALFLEENDVAHVPIVVGICAFDSARVGPALALLSDFARERGVGDITWRYLEKGAPASQCDFYLMTSLQAASGMVAGEIDCALIATVKEGRSYARGAIIVRPGDGLPPPGGSMLFSSSVSAAGFLSPYRALEQRYGKAPEEVVEIEFAGYFPDEERVAFAVMYGAYSAGGVSIEGLETMRESGTIRPDELEIALAGDPMPEIVLASNRPVDARKVRNIQDRLPPLSHKMPRQLSIELARIGIAGFALPRERDIEQLERMAAALPEFLRNEDAP